MRTVVAFAECTKWFGAGWNSAQGGMKQYEWHFFSCLAQWCWWVKAPYYHSAHSRTRTDIHSFHADAVNAHFSHACSHSHLQVCTLTHTDNTSITMQHVCCSGTTSAVTAILPYPCFCFFPPFPCFSALLHPLFPHPPLSPLSFPLSSFIPLILQFTDLLSLFPSPLPFSSFLCLSLSLSIALSRSRWCRRVLSSIWLSGLTLWEEW